MTCSTIIMLICVRAVVHPRFFGYLPRYFLHDFTLVSFLALVSFLLFVFFCTFVMYVMGMCRYVMCMSWTTCRGLEDNLGALNLFFFHVKMNSGVAPMLSSLKIKCFCLLSHLTNSGVYFLFVLLFFLKQDLLNPRLAPNSLCSQK